jgi:hypothetical protein
VGKQKAVSTTNTIDKMRLALFQGLLLLASSRVFTANGLRVGIFGDTGVGYEGEQVFKLMRDSSVNLVVQHGDLDYQDNPGLWDRFLNQNWFAGSDKRGHITTSGNKETLGSGNGCWDSSWSSYGRPFKGYKERQLGYLDDFDKLRMSCNGRAGKTLRNDYGEFMTCEVDQVVFVMIGFDQMDAIQESNDVVDFIRTSLKETDAIWKVCVWHRTEGKLTPGGNARENGQFAAYKACREAGAIVTSGHSHVYARSKLLESFENAIVSPRSNANNVQLSCGESISIVSGAVNGMMGDRYGADNMKHIQKVRCGGGKHVVRFLLQTVCFSVSSCVGEGAPVY